MSTRRRLLLLLALIAPTACATTRPYQREHLARAEMAPDPDPDEAALYQHLLGTREGAVGGALARSTLARGGEADDRSHSGGLSVSRDFADHDTTLQAS